MSPKYLFHCLLWVVSGQHIPHAYYVYTTGIYLSTDAECTVVGITIKSELSFRQYFERTEKGHVIGELGA